MNNLEHIIMKRIAIVFLLALLAFASFAQGGEIISIKVVGMDHYSSGPKINTEVTVKYSQIRQGQAYLILYADNAPLQALDEVKKYDSYGILTGKICCGYVILSPTSGTITKTYKVLLPIRYKRLTNGTNDIFYLQAMLLDNFNRVLMGAAKTQTDISKLKITTYQESSNTPQEKAKRAQEHAAEVKTSQQMGNMLGAFLGASLMDTSVDLCSNCNGAGCSECNGTGYDGTARYFARKGMEAGYKLAEQANARKVLNGNHTVTYENGKYTGNYKDGLRHGKGTYTYNDGEKYVGDWEYGKKTGRGTLTTASGDKYVGEFVNDKMHGNGELSVSGCIYKGWFHQDQMSGIGTVYLKKEKKYIKGIWEDGELVKVIKQGTYTGNPATTSTKKTTSSTARRK